MFITSLNLRKPLANTLWRAVWLFCLASIFQATLWAGVQVYTSPEIVAEGAPDAATSAIAMHIDSDVFADASEIAPVFVKVSLRDGVVLTDTLVDVNADPIYLAIQLFGNGPGIESQLSASPTAVAMVRHVAGESAIWLRVSESSSCWISIDDQKESPSPHRPVAIHFGNDALDSFNQTIAFYQLGWANLPSNTKQPNAPGGPETAADTRIRVDLTGSSLVKGGSVMADFEAFDGATGVRTESNPQNIVTGSILPIFDIPEASLADIFPRVIFPGYDFLVGGLPVILPETGSCDRVGSLIVSMSEAAFPQASEEDPVYLRIQLSSEVLLCETLVDPRLPESNPIYLALKLSEEVGPDQMVAPPNAAAIIRWIEGEGAIWVRITSPTDTWVSPAGSPGGPPRFVELVLGMSGSESLGQNQAAHQAGKANLPANTANLQTEEPASTIMKADLSGGGVSPLATELWAHVRTFVESSGVETGVSPDDIDLGTGLGLEGGGLLAILPKGQLPWDGLVLNSVPVEIEPGGTCETGGSLSFTVGDNLFPNATTETPTYIKIALPSDTTLCETIVGPQSFDPIHLALSLERSDSESQVAAPPETVSIVRWVAGESDIWLRISHPTFLWLENNQLMPPNPDDRVLFTIGIDGPASKTLNEVLFLNDQANLPGNVRSSQGPTFENPASTLIKVNISQAAMVPDPNPASNWRAYVSVDPKAYDFALNVETALNPSEIIASVFFPLPFPGSREIAFTTEIVIDPPVANQGLDVITMEARPANDVNPVEYKWVNAENNQVISNYPSIIFDPIPTDTVRVRLEVRDPQGRTSYAEGTLHVNSDVFDLNNDGRNDILDLLFALPDWGKTHDILFLISIPLE